MHFISTDLPFRLTEFHPGLAFHQVQTPSYPLFREPQYMLSLANRLVQVAREFRLAIVHAHYAVPHATAALLAPAGAASGAGPALKVMTTLHGTDITLVGSDPSYSEIVAYSIEQSDGVTAVSREPRRCDAAAARRAARDRRHPELHRLHAVQAPAGSRCCGGASRRATTRSS